MKKAHNRIVEVLQVAFTLCAAAKCLGSELRSMHIDRVFGYSPEIASLLVIMAASLGVALLARKGSDP
jgi:hypothetical protein